jgi:GMP synthase PP-ATPase subunit
MDLHVVRARSALPRRPAGVVEPEQKRKIIGREFIEVFAERRARSARCPSSPRARSIPT